MKGRKIERQEKCKTESKKHWKEETQECRKKIRLTEILTESFRIEKNEDTQK